MLDCYYKKYLGAECLGCGAQRSFIELIEGNVSESLTLFPALIPILFTIVYLLLHLKYKFKKGAKVLVILFSVSTFLMIVNFIIKLV